MLKKFFTVMLGSMAAIWLSAIIALVLLGVFVGSIFSGIVAGRGDSTAILDKSVLVIDLKGTIAEREAAGSLRSELIGDEGITGTLCEYIAAIDKAAGDDRIKGMLILGNGSSLGTASRQELIEAIERFRSKKFVIAYADSYSQGDYYVACAAQEVFLNPVGSVGLHGISAQIPFFTGLMEKVGVKMQIIKVGKFKSAVEPFVLKSASEPSILQTKTYIDGIWNEVAGYIADRRGTSPDTVTVWAGEIASVFSAERLVEDSIVDRLAYRREVDDILRKRTGLDKDDELRLVYPADYLTSGMPLSDSATNPDKFIAVYYATGDIVDSGREGISGAVVAPDIISLADDEKVAGLILRVNSGGGSAFASEQIWDAIEYFKSKGKPVYASMSDVAASGGYYISCGADRIFADPATLTGSIGIFGMIPDFQGLVTGKLGINFTTVESNHNAGFIDVMRPMPSDQIDAMQKMVERGYETFVSRVAKGRGMEVDSVKRIAEGRVWYGRDALRIGLVDTLASLNTARKEMAAELHLSDGDFVNYPSVEYPMLIRMIRMLDSQEEIYSIFESAGISADLQRLPVVRRLCEILSQVAGGAHLQARIEDITVY